VQGMYSSTRQFQAKADLITLGPRTVLVAVMFMSCTLAASSWMERNATRLIWAACTLLFVYRLRSRSTSTLLLRFSPDENIIETITAKQLNVAGLRDGLLAWSHHLRCRQSLVQSQSSSFRALCTFMVRVRVHDHDEVRKEEMRTTVAAPASSFPQVVEVESV